MRTDPGLAWYGRYVVSTRVTTSGFVFQYVTLESALRNLYDDEH
ncbi:MAG: DUF1731 domain-containing protein [Planctomycetota bacterium]|nr:DUF1731 domain-containing protein [Planctomycetota bacterium]